MTQTTTSTQSAFDKSVYNPTVFKMYKITKKIVKYTLYAALLYFAWEGFMAWK